MFRGLFVGRFPRGSQSERSRLVSYFACALQTLARLLEALDSNTIVGVREEPRLSEQVQHVLLSPTERIVRRSADWGPPLLANADRRCCLPVLCMLLAQAFGNFQSKRRTAWEARRACSAG